MDLSALSNDMYCNAMAIHSEDGFTLYTTYIVRGQEEQTGFAWSNIYMNLFPAKPITFNL